MNALLSAQLHDIGQIGVNDKILTKSGALTDAEYEAIKSHTEYEMNVMRQIKDCVTNGSMLHFKLKGALENMDARLTKTIVDNTNNKTPERHAETVKNIARSILISEYEDAVE